MSAGHESLSNSTVPILHWLFEAEVGSRYELPIRTIPGGDSRRENTFHILEKLPIPPNEFEGPFNKTEFPGYWFSDDASDDLIVAALDYLGSVGDSGVEV